MAVTASQLRQDIYRLLDQVIATGEDLEIRRNGHTLRVVAERPRPRIAEIQPIQRLIKGDPDDLVTVDWSNSWDADRTIAP